MRFHTRTLRRTILIGLSIAAVAFAFSPGIGGSKGGPEGTMGWSPGYPLPKHDAVFSISAQSPNGPITAVVVEYGDGVTDTITAPRSTTSDLAACLFGDRLEATRMHQYAQVGDYYATLTVTSGSCPGVSFLSPTQYTHPFRITVQQATAANQDQHGSSSGTTSGTTSGIGAPPADQPLIPALPR